MLARPEASAELTSPCAAAVAGTLQEVPGPSVLCDEIPCRLSRWFVDLSCFAVVLYLTFTYPTNCERLFRTSPSLQKQKCFHTLDRNGGLIISACRLLLCHHAMF